MMIWVKCHSCWVYFRYRGLALDDRSNKDDDLGEVSLMLDIFQVSRSNTRRQVQER